MTTTETEIADNILSEIKEATHPTRHSLVQEYAEFVKACGARAGGGVMLELSEMVTQAKKEIAALATL